MDLGTMAALAKMVGEGGGNRTVVSDPTKLAAFKHIEGLEAGNKVKRVQELGVKFPKRDEEVVVYRIFNPPIRHVEKGSPVREEDFSILIEDGDGELLEYSYDSRYFLKV